MPDDYAIPTYWKIETSTPNVINPLRNLFESEAIIEGIQLPKQTFESNIPYVLRFMIDKELVGMGWMQIQNYQIIRKEEEDNPEQSKQKDRMISKCQL